MALKPRSEQFELRPVGDAHFSKLLRLAAEKIKKEARGRVCKDCVSFSYGVCEKYTSLMTGSSLLCSDDSVACCGFKKKRKIKK